LKRCCGGHGAARALPRLVAELVAGVAVIAVTAYLAAREGLGNPFAGLGSTGSLPPETVEALRRVYGLDKPVLQGLLGFLASLARGSTGPSIVYGRPALAVAAEYLPWTLAAVSLGALAAAAGAVAWVIVAGPRVPRLLRMASFVPGYFYAVLLMLASWRLGWPSPLPSHGVEKTAVYALVVFAAAWPRLLHSAAGLAAGLGHELGGYLSALRAMGVPGRRANIHLLRLMAAPLSAYFFMLFAGVLERSVILEPLIGYAGLGRLLYEAVTSADPVLAAAAFTLLGGAAFMLVSAGRLLESLLDPRLGEG
jgi:peptide/nickel transport system permease protein